MKFLAAFLLCLGLLIAPAYAQFNGTSGIFALNHMTFGLMATPLKVLAGGTGYIVNDTITLSCPSFDTNIPTAPILTVTSASAGAITGVVLTNPGYATAIPSTGLAGGLNGICNFNQLSTSGSGSGGTFYGQFGFNAANLTSTINSNIDVTLPPYNAICDGTTDTHAALIAAKSAALAGGYGLTIPDKTCYNTSLIDFGAVPVHGAVPIVPTTSFTGPEILCPASIATACVNIGAPTPGNVGGHIDNVVIAYSGTPIAGDAGLSVEASGSTCDHIFVYNSYDAFTFQNGALARCYELFTGKIYNHHIVQNGFPEVSITNSRFGSNGAIDVQSAAYILETGNDPNTLLCVNCQFNQGGGATTHYFMDFSGVTAQGNGIYKISNSYIEDTDTALIHGDGTGGCFRCDFSNSTFNSTAVLQSFTGTPTLHGIFEQALFTGSDFYLTTFNFPAGQINSGLSNIWIIGNATFTGGSGSYGNISNMTVNGNFTLSGAWSGLNIANLKVNGTYADTATGKIEASNIPAISWTPGINFSTSNTGVIVSSSSGTSQRQPDGTVAFQFGAQLSAIGSASGSATVTGLPYTCISYGYGAQYPQVLWGVNLTGLTGAILAGGTPSAATLTLYQQGAGGVSSVTAANFTASSIISGSAQCQPQ